MEVMEGVKGGPYWLVQGLVHFLHPSHSSLCEVNVLIGLVPTRYLGLGLGLQRQFKARNESSHARDVIKKQSLLSAKKYWGKFPHLMGCGGSKRDASNKIEHNISHSCCNLFMKSKASLPYRPKPCNSTAIR
ncbi:fibroblast growth factor 22 [Platysternon megacephalum]|uniref:Fibroblast growth factor 22 n=1 Tax=Platysternon megacephalum TaxID=55544 RepID=A0A4D9EIZ0_9SAUR|nr:fibroblast growth factor 22 [Platysternon megacephalum]